MEHLGKGHLNKAHKKVESIKQNLFNSQTQKFVIDKDGLVIYNTIPINM